MRDLVVPGRHGVPGGPAGVTVRAKAGVLLAEIVALRGKAHVVERTLADAYAITPPPARRRSRAGGFALWWSGPDRWLWEAHAGDESDMERLQLLLAGIAAVVPQTEGRRLVHVSGARVIDALRKGFTIDLHPAVFRENDTAMTVVGGMDVQIARVEADTAYDIVVYRSFSASFWAWLKASAAEFGLEASAA